jgi:hypothetical protein
MSGKTQLTKRNCDSNAVACNQRKNVVHFWRPCKKFENAPCLKKSQQNTTRNRMLDIKFPKYLRDQEKVCKASKNLAADRSTGHFLVIEYRKCKIEQKKHTWINKANQFNSKSQPWQTVKYRIASAFYRRNPKSFICKLD